MSGMDFDKLSGKIDALADKVGALAEDVAEMRGELGAMRASAARRWHPATITAFVVGTIATLAIGASRFILALSAGGVTMGAASPASIDAVARALEEKRAAVEAAAHPDAGVDTEAPAGVPLSRR